MKSKFFYCASILLFLSFSMLQVNGKDLMKVNSGVLLGLRNEKSNTYTTFWISPQDGKMKVIRGNNIFVPYGNYFWEIENVKYNDRIQYLIPHQAGVKGQYKQFKSRDEVEEGEQITTNASMKLLFVGNKYLSYGYEDYIYPVGSPHGFMCRGSIVCTISAMDLGNRESISIADILGNPAIDIAKKYRARIKYDSAPEGLFEPEENKIMWQITRGPGKFIPQVCKTFQVYSLGADYRSSTLPMDLPENIVIYDELKINFGNIKKIIPNVIDAVSSPNGDLLIVLTKSKILVFNKLENSDSRPCLEINIDSSSIVMAQWVIGKYIPKWNDSIMKYLK